MAYIIWGTGRSLLTVSLAVTVSLILHCRAIIYTLIKDTLATNSIAMLAFVTATLQCRGDSKYTCVSGAASVNTFAACCRVMTHP